MTSRAASVFAYALMLLAGIAETVSSARAEGLVAALSQETVFIESNFTGASLTLFGSIERDAETIGRSGTYDLVVVVRGPDTWPVVRRKANVYGVWLNRDSVRFRGVPTYYAIQSNRPPEEIADQAILERYEIGLENLSFKPTSDITEQERAAFADALIRLRLSEALFNQAPTRGQFPERIRVLHAHQPALQHQHRALPDRAVPVPRRGAAFAREHVVRRAQDRPRGNGFDRLGILPRALRHRFDHHRHAAGLACRTDVPAGLGFPRLQRRRRA